MADDRSDPLTTDLQ